MLSIVLLLSACSGNGGGGGSKDLNTGEEKPKSEQGGQKTVAISVMMKDRFLEAAARKFEEQHKDIHIEIKEYRTSQPAAEGSMSMEAISLGDVEKYVQSVTTQVISGKGPDLMLMSELPQDKFVAKKLLVNLNDLMAGDSSFDQNALYSNIFQASQDGDGIYAMPLSFSISLFQGNTELLKNAGLSVDADKPWSWKEFKEAAKKLKLNDSDKLISLDPTGLLFDFIEDSYNQLVEKGQPKFDSELFRTMLTDIKSMYEDGLLNESFSFNSNKAAFQMVNIFSPEQALTMPNGLDFYQKPNVSGQKEGSAFRPIYSLGINSKSAVQQEAWAFIKFLLSEEMQASPDLSGLPMNKSVNSSKLKEISQKIETGTLETMVPADMLPDGETAKKRVDAVEKLISNAGHRRTSDMKVIMIAMEEFKSFMSGQKSAEEVSKLIQNRVKTYLNE
ncbi:ABC transporter substrate-binding protein [Paenibacillus gorillae]|uniref:ABC transporter substrate-binding protein n=1 Tax=Paenibacillus gorillae TaxID=1243662 RepID=UPI00138AC000|nr:extracellular solute-binding protein [Paenibacillus gorillae]